MCILLVLLLLFKSLISFSVSFCIFLFLCILCVYLCTNSVIITNSAK